MSGSDEITGAEPALPADADNFAPMLGGSLREVPIALAKEAYTAGYEKGYDAGYAHGRNDGYEGYELAPDYTGASVFTYDGAFATIYQKSYALGYREGYDAGYNKGHEDGAQEAELAAEDFDAPLDFDEEVFEDDEEYDGYTKEELEEDLSPEMVIGEDDEWEDDDDDDWIWGA
ncbi:MAG: hypothetical protein JXB47_11650 [Anaerolineae bacterium]|nr:hypothetical protein [Anaerolineae bacterium]